MDFKKNLITYSIVGTPVMYIGNLVAENRETGHVTISEALMGLSSKDGNVQFTNVPHAKKTSNVVINTKAAPGIMVCDPDEELVRVYERAVVQAYSNLTLV